jgi:hypothetical protein
MLLHGQEWNVLGLPAGTYYNVVVASDTAMYYASGHLHRQGADRKWRQLREVGDVGRLDAWGDTVVLLTSASCEMSTDAGVTWRTASVQGFNLIMPGTERVVKTGPATDTTIGLMICEPFKNVCVQTIIPKQNPSYDLYVCRGLAAVVYRRADSLWMSMLYMPTMDTTTWRREERRIASRPIDVVGADGLAYLQDTALVYIRTEGEDTLHIRRDMIRQYADYQVCRYVDGWVMRTMVQTDAQFYRSDDGVAWENVTGLMPQYYCWISGVQGNHIIVTTDAAGPIRMDAKTGVVSRDVLGLGHRAEMFTDGRYVVVYDHDKDHNLAILEDMPDGAQLLFDTVMTSMITGVYLIGDSVWVVADSVYSLDLVTRAWSNERFPMSINRYRSAGVSALPGGVGIYHEGAVYYRVHGDTSWQRIDTNRREYVEPEVFVGTDDGYMMIRSEGYDIDLEYLYALRFTMSGDLIGTRSLIGDGYSWGTLGQRGLRRVGNTYYLTINHRPGPYSTDHGSTWFTGIGAFELGCTPSALWGFDASNPSTCLAGFSTDLGTTWKIMSVPDFTPYRIDQLFCLDHHCYAMGEDGVMTIPRPTVGVQEEHTEQPTLLPGDRAVVYNALGEMVAALPVIDGVLAPYDLSILPMQPLWAVSGGVVVRVR